MATPTTLHDTKVIQTYGNRDDIFSLAKRIKTMVPGGSKLSDPEAQALAQVSLVTQCNPFIGEIWYIPGRGPMIGIKGARRHGNEQIEEAGGKDAYWTPDLQVCTPDEAGAADIKDVAFSYRCVITDSVSTTKYQKMFLETVNSLRAAGDPDPVGTAREICGKRPQWIGYGYSTHGESTKMSKHAAARKRAEADALKQRFDIPFGTEIAAGDTAQDSEVPGWIEAEAEQSETVDTTPKIKNSKEANIAILTGEGNPDPINDKLWDAFLALANRAEKVDVPYNMPSREATTKNDLQVYMAELTDCVLNAERQAAVGS